MKVASPVLAFIVTLAAATVGPRALCEEGSLAFDIALLMQSELAACARPVMPNTRRVEIEVGDWRLVCYARGPRLELMSNERVQHQLVSDGSGSSRLLKITKLPDGIELIEYDAGEHGTSVVVETFRAVVFDSRKNRILGDFPRYYLAKSARRAQMILPQPEWRLSEQKIIIFEPEEPGEGMQTVIDLRERVANSPQAVFTLTR